MWRTTLAANHSHACAEAAAIDLARNNWQDTARLKHSTPPADSPNNAHPAGDRLWIAGLIVVLCFLAWALCRNITLPWTEDDNWYGAVYSQAAHMNLQAGLLTTAGVPVTLYFGPLPLPPDAFYVHHPTLLPTLITGAFAVFGESEWAARLVPVACSLLSAVLLWLLVRSAVNVRAATLTAAIFATLPMELHYGDMVDFEPCLLMCMLAVLLCLRYWQVTSHRRWTVLASACILLTLWMDWPGYLFVLSLAGYFLLRGWKGGGFKRDGILGESLDVGCWTLDVGCSPASSGREREHPTSNIQHPTSNGTPFSTFSPNTIPPRQSLRFGLLLVGLVGLSGVIFLLQIRHVRPDAWSDLWNAATMRLSNSTATDATSAATHPVSFTLRQWCAAILNGLANDFLPLPWFLAALGIVFLWIGRRESPGLRWCALAMMPMTVAGVLYVVILRNESYVHDFATFYLIGAIALAAGLGLEGLLARLDLSFPGTASRVLGALVIAGMFTWLGLSAVQRSEAMRSPFSVLDAGQPEPPDFIPSLGRFLGQTFPPGTTILCNFAASGTLDYYSQRNVLNNLMTPDDWKAFLASEPPPLGGIIWLDAPQASAVIASLPREEMREIIFQGFRFALWRAKS